MKRQPMILSSLLTVVAAIIALLTMDYVSESFPLLLAVLTYFIYSISEDMLKISQAVIGKYSQARKL